MPLDGPLFEKKQEKDRKKRSISNQFLKTGKKKKKNKDIYFMRRVFSNAVQVLAPRNEHCIYVVNNKINHLILVQFCPVR